MGKLKVTIDNIESIRSDQKLVFSPLSKHTIRKLGIEIHDITIKSDKEIKNIVKSNDSQIIEMYREHFEKKRIEMIDILKKEY